MSITIQLIVVFCVGTALAFAFGYLLGRKVTREDAASVAWGEFDRMTQHVFSPSARLLCTMIERRLIGAEFDAAAEWKEFARIRDELGKRGAK